MAAALKKMAANATVKVLIDMDPVDEDRAVALLQYLPASHWETLDQHAPLRPLIKFCRLQNEAKGVMCSPFDHDRRPEEVVKWFEQLKAHPSLQGRLMSHLCLHNFGRCMKSCFQAFDEMEEKGLLTDHMFDALSSSEIHFYGEEKRLPLRSLRLRRLVGHALLRASDTHTALDALVRYRIDPLTVPGAQADVCAAALVLKELWSSQKKEDETPKTTPSDKGPLAKKARLSRT